MRIYLFFTLASLLLTFNLAVAEPFKPMIIPIAEERKDKTTLVNGKEKNKGAFIKTVKLPFLQERRIEKISINGKDYYQIKEYQKMFNDQVVEATSLVEIGDYLKAHSYHYVKRDPHGKDIEKLEVLYKNKSWNYSEDTYSIPMLILIFRSLIDQNIKETSFHLWLDDFAVFRMKLKVMGKEKIKVPLGDFTCVKIKMQPDARSILPIGEFFASLAQPFMPDFYFWFWEKEPYPLVKFDGSAGSPGAPRTVEEIIEYKDLQAVNRLVTNRNAVE